MISKPTIHSPSPTSSRTHSKPKVIHIVKDRKMGGVESTLGHFVNSDLAEEFEFSFLVAEQDQLIARSKDIQPDVIVCHFPLRLKEYPRLFLLRRSFPHAKLIFNERGYSEGYERFNVRSLRRFHFMLRLSYQLGDRVIAISQSQIAWMLKNRLVPSSKITLIRSCSQLDQLFELPEKAIGSPLILGAYGRFCFHKGFDVLIKAIQLIPQVPVQIYLGGEGVQAEELKQLAQGLENITWLGRITDVPHFLQQCDVVVIPSRWEPWGNVCLEAKAAGKPVIASDVDGLSEQVQNCGLLVAPDDPVQLAEAIEQMAALPKAQLMHWGKEGRASVNNHQVEYVEHWRSLLRELLSGSNTVTNQGGL